MEHIVDKIRKWLARYSPLYKGGARRAGDFISPFVKGGGPPIRIGGPGDFILPFLKGVPRLTRGGISFSFPKGSAASDAGRDLWKGGVNPPAHGVATSFRKGGIDSRSGYIAITAAVVVSALVLLLVFSISLSSYLALNGTSAAGYKEISRGLAEGCVEVARFNLSQNSSYAGNEAVTISSSTCQIVSVTASSTNKTIRTSASYQNSFTDLQVTVNPSTNVLVNWREI